MNRRLAIFSGTFNPPGAHHRAAVQALLRHFDEVVVVPGGPRPDRPVSGPTEALHRAAMTDLAFRDLPRVRVDHSDLEHAQFTRTHALEEKYRRDGEVWHAVGGDMVRGGGAGESFIHAQWERGPELWRSLNFAVLPREGYELAADDLPPRHLLVATAQSGASATVRERVFRGEEVRSLLSPAVADYVDRYGLYRGTPPPRTAPLTIAEPRPLLVFDEANPAARKIVDAWPSAATSPGAANCILVIGGDGMMISAVRQYWSWRLPFIGLNAGHRGHLLNDSDRLAAGDAIRSGWRAQLLPLLYVETADVSGRKEQHYAINDAWVERAGGQAAWLEVSVDGQTRIPKLVADGVLVATAVGSTAYARSMGATPLPIDAPAFLVVGSNVVDPTGWKSAHLPLESSVGIRVLESGKRPVRAYVDASGRGLVQEMRVRVSRTAAVELAFVAERDIQAKMAAGLFPRH